MKSNRESGKGRYDIGLIPKNPQKDPGIIIECKIKQSAEEAVLQIQEKGYTAELKQHGCKRAFLYGIFFRGKDTTIEMVEEDF